MNTPTLRFNNQWSSSGAELGAANREAVRQFFATHLGCTNVECGRALGLSTMTVGRHVAAIRKEWLTTKSN